MGSLMTQPRLSEFVLHILVFVPIEVPSAAMSSGGRCGANCGSSTYVILLHAESVTNMILIGSHQQSCISLEGEYVSSFYLSSLHTAHLTISTYLVSSAIDIYYYTQIIGDAKNPPTLLASRDFDGAAVIGQSFQI